jgi:hypothetical protein
MESAAFFKGVKSMISKSTKRILGIILACIIVFFLGNLLRVDRFDWLEIQYVWELN